MENVNLLDFWVLGQQSTEVENTRVVLSLNNIQEIKGCYNMKYQIMQCALIKSKALKHMQLSTQHHKQCKRGNRLGTYFWTVSLHHLIIAANVMVLWLQYISVKIPLTFDWPQNKSSFFSFWMNIFIQDLYRKWR